MLGRGGFGPVYYGKLASGQEAAVKVSAKGSNQGFKEFINEVLHLRSTRAVLLSNWFVSGRYVQFV